ncbi:MAG: transketolase [Eubacteriaceae bacterium]|nr:transketolase [Eubacteriaceae bacterium]
MNSKLEEIALEMRKNIIMQLYSAGSGHPGGSLSAADIIAFLYFEEMNIPSFSDPNRDRFVLSKGHAAPALYSALAEKGSIDKGELITLRKLGSRLQGHPSMGIDGIEVPTGSLGLGLSAAVGMALAAKLDGAPYRTYALCGDGEIQEGIVWEALMAASHYGLGSLTVIVDNNGLQIDGPVSDVMSPYPIAQKAIAFGFDAFECSGHSFDSLREAFAKAKASPKPAMVIAETVKGKGVGFMENDVGWHGKAPNKEEYEQAMACLEG